MGGMDSLAHQLLIAGTIVSATVVIHLAGLDILQILLRWHLHRLERWVQANRVLVPIGIVMGLFVVHGAEIWLYALAYLKAGVFKGLEQSLYFSVSAYSTLGEGRSGMPISWRIVGALEAINGMLLLGWSTAFLFQTLGHLMWDEDGVAGLPRGAIARRVRRARPEVR
jgi:hypothetical protein